MTEKSYMKHPAPSSMVCFVGDRHTVELDSLDNKSGLKELRSIRKTSFGNIRRDEGGFRPHKLLLPRPYRHCCLAVDLLAKQGVKLACCDHRPSTTKKQTTF